MNILQNFPRFIDFFKKPEKICKKLKNFQDFEDINI